jgi:hypothetical protein
MPFRTVVSESIRSDPAVAAAVDRINRWVESHARRIEGRWVAAWADAKPSAGESAVHPAPIVVFDLSFAAPGAKLEECGGSHREDVAFYREDLARSDTWNLDVRMGQFWGHFLRESSHRPVDGLMETAGVGEDRPHGRVE